MFNIRPNYIKGIKSSRWIISKDKPATLRLVHSQALSSCRNSPYYLLWHVSQAGRTSRIFTSINIFRRQLFSFHRRIYDKSAAKSTQDVMVRGG
jgi:wobble nucleotide-excising tRNase